MPLDRNPQNNLRPKLASNRTAKTPLTPRLASVSPSATTGSAQPGRPARSSHAAAPRVSTTTHEDVTPVKAFLNSNVTPRSSSRKSRAGVESASSTPSGTTPSGTPTSSRPSSSLDFPPQEHGMGSKSAHGGVRQRGTPGQGGPPFAPRSTPPLSHIHNSVPADAGSAKSTSPLFFHASDARDATPHDPAPTHKKAPVFFYANGKQDELRRKSDMSSPPLPAAGRLQSESKFFHADSVSEARNQPRNNILSATSVSPEPLDPHPVHGQSFRAPSPTKEWAHLSYRKGASQVMRPSIASRNSALSILSGPNTPDIPDRSGRRSSAASYALRGTHGKSASLSSIDSVTDPRNLSLNESVGLSPSPLNTESRVASIASLAESTSSAPSPPMPTFSTPQSPGSASPTKAVQSALETMNELAANARRERKVLDLEISNSSLLAINRTLEKEVRKQKAELRRFRRMSRAGRITADATEGLDSSPLLGSSHIGDLSDMSEEEEGDEMQKLEEEAPDSSDESFDEAQLSPSAQLERDEVHRFGDEKRLQLDISKHRDLLLDSQKMNQSLKRCMNWTEQLIKDGQKALEYQVRPSDVKLGGRVLVVEDDHDTQAEESKSLLSPWSPLHRATDDIEALDSPFFANAMERIVDRDSGVDVDGLGALDQETPETPTSLGSPFEERIRRLQASIEALS
ncbi:hypothetical protein BDU57DRAFT_318339 [Ampelomyces quisqualis]|uniref:Uncharacterized protein n=1 Tax=Ampelomyces quisqualis TaxID=50730 RepID=A0A6A5QE60_AMPQU|nr:hypothetical protein BDU57DRAFT_318339 [Ampelomyces quisqualis]